MTLLYDWSWFRLSLVFNIIFYENRYGCEFDLVNGFLSFLFLSSVWWIFILIILHFLVFIYLLLDFWFIFLVFFYFFWDSWFVASNADFYCWTNAGKKFLEKVPCWWMCKATDQLPFSCEKPSPFSLMNY